MFADFCQSSLCQRQYGTILQLHIRSTDQADIVHIHKKRAVCQNKFRVLQKLVTDSGKTVCAGDLFSVCQIIKDFSSPVLPRT